MYSKRCRKRAEARGRQVRRQVRRSRGHRGPRHPAEVPRRSRRRPDTRATDMRAPASSLLALLALLSLGGCLLGPNHERPAVDAPPAFRFAEPDAKDLVNPAWWEQFQDPALNQLIATALADSKDVKTA